MGLAASPSPIARRRPSTATGCGSSLPVARKHAGRIDLFGLPNPLGGRGAGGRAASLEGLVGAGLVSPGHARGVREFRSGWMV
jgi:hypothetical protein